MKLMFREKLGNKESPYLVRWVLDFGRFSIRLHHWLSSDDTRNFHDHEWDFVSVVLFGKMVDRTAEGDTIRPMFSVKKFKAEHQHSVVIDKPCWSLLFTSKKRRTWGFWVNGKFRKRNKYFFEHGHH